MRDWNSVDWQLAGPIGLLPQSGSTSEKVDLWDAIIGVRGKARLGEGGWFVPYYSTPVPAPRH